MLSSKLKPKFQYDLVRIGSSSDGGYLVEQQSLQKSHFLIGLGINDDWSFEKCFNKPFIGIDNQISFKFLIKKSIAFLPKFFLPNVFIKLLKSIKKIFEFIIIKNKFINASVSNYTSEDKSVISLSEIINNYCNTEEHKNIFLKLDIEGSEYRLFNDIIKNQNLFTGIVIELHDIDMHMDKILNFIDLLDMDIVHIHPNNFGGVDKYNDPLVIEVTFSRLPNKISDKAILPHYLDTPNDKDSNDIQLNFKDL